ncbi:MAG: hypothetical protein AB8B96_11530 [Lysobacterales bacterium]
MTLDTDPQISRLLSDLPDKGLPAHLWHRILQTQLADQRRKSRRNGWLAVGAMAAALGLALGLGLTLGQSVELSTDRQPSIALEVQPAVGNQLAALMQRTEQLERSLREQRDEFARLASTQQQWVRAQQAQIIALDQSLALAYERNESADALALLWQRRVDLMADLISIYDTSGGAGSA